VLVLHGGAMVERGGSLEWGLACTMVYGFQRFRAQIKAEVKGFSPRGILDGGDHRSWHTTVRLQLLSLAMTGGSSKGWNRSGLRQTGAA
jgi:hypothetical protein